MTVQRLSGLSSENDKSSAQIISAKRLSEPCPRVMRIRRGHGISQCNRGSGQSDSERHSPTEGHPRDGPAGIDEDVLLLHAHVALPEGHRRVRSVHHARGDGPVAPAEHGVPRGRALDEHADQRLHGSAGNRCGRRSRGPDGLPGVHRADDRPLSQSARSEVQAVRPRFARSALLAHGEHEQHAKADVLLLQDAPRQRTHLPRRHGTRAERREPAPRERGVSRRWHRDTGPRPIPRQARPVPPGGEDAIGRSLDGEARERGSLVGREKGMRAREKELEQSERSIADREQEFDATRQQVLAKENSLVAREQELAKRLDSLVRREEEFARRDTEAVTHAKDIAARKTEIASRQEQIVKLLEDQKATLDAQIGRNRELMERERKLASEEEDFAAARAKIAEEGKRLLDREKALLAQEQSIKSMAAAPAQMPAVSVKAVPTTPAPQVVLRPQPVPSNPAPVAAKPAAQMPVAVAQVAKPVVKVAVQAEPAAGSESEIPCPACGTMISSDAIMCYACGHRLQDEAAAEETSETEGESEIPCPACGTRISSDAIMCYACGHRMADEDKASKKGPVSVKKVMKKKVI